MSMTPGGRSIAEEHGAIRDMAGQILRAMDCGNCGCGAPGDRSCFHDHLEGFRRRLISHFETEETQWSRADLARADWTTVRWVDRLVHEHREFEERLARILPRVEAAMKGGEPPSAEIEPAIRAILADLLDHELSETRLFQRSIFEGSVDPG